MAGLGSSPVADPLPVAEQVAIAASDLVADLEDTAGYMEEVPAVPANLRAYRNYYRIFHSG